MDPPKMDEELGTDEETDNNIEIGLGKCKGDNKATMVCRNPKCSLQYKFYCHEKCKFCEPHNKCDNRQLKGYIEYLKTRALLQRNFYTEIHNIDKELADKLTSKKETREKYYTIDL